ncbi:GTP-binding protein, putative [Plasmodium malariae]|uniref:GTP-binding protein, putative n=1 Tax=Plasmodium malariae TaxID=5858 RepID=A0A1D3SN72_PLAMA|nr:GTP-binding protein, putative [Plasmodium malariae]SCO93298.1 GTP-binding protein, putative [Plasmodium malariae]
MVNYFKYFNEILTKRYKCLNKWLIEKGKNSYSIKIIHKSGKKNEVKVYGNSPNKIKKREKEKETYDDMDDANTLLKKKKEDSLIGIKNDLYKIKSCKSIFYESEKIIKCESGAGGDGTVSFKKFKRKILGSLGIPNGGKGGNGGNIYLCYSDFKGHKYKNKRRKNNKENKYIYVNNLSELPCVLSATNGRKGKVNQLRGNSGTNIYVYLNKMCHVYKLVSSFKGGSAEDSHETDGNARDRDNHNGTDNCNVSDSDNYDYSYSDRDNHNDKDKSANNAKGELENRAYILKSRTKRSKLLDLSVGGNRENIHSVKNNKNNIGTDNVRDYNVNYVKYNYEENVYNALKREDPIYIKRNKHIIKEIMCLDEKIRKEIYIGFLSENNNCMLICKGGEGGKGNNMQNTFSYEKGKKGVINYIRIVYKCISDICFIGYKQSGKSTLLSLITHKIHTVNNLYILKKIIFKDNLQISVADFFNHNEDELNQNKNKEKINSFYITPNVFKYLELTHLLVIILDINNSPITQFRNIREELKLKDERIYRKPYIVVINKCDIKFDENIKKAEAAYKEIKMYAGDGVPVFFISAKYAVGVADFVLCLRNCVQKLKHGES